MSVAFIPKSLANQVENIHVLSIYAAALDPTVIFNSSGSTTGQKTNHWVLYFAISETESIRLDPSPGSDNKLALVVNQKNCLSLVNVVKTFQLYTAKNITVGNIIEHLRSSNYIQYQFSAGGQGCRYWIDSVLVLLRTARYIPDESEVDKARAALQVVWDDTGKAGDGEQAGILAGTFY